MWHRGHMWHRGYLMTRPSWSTHSNQSAGTRLRCSCSGQHVPYLTWVRGSYWAGGYYACDTCLRERNAGFCFALALLAAIALVPIAAFIGWVLLEILRALAQTAVLH